MIFVITRVLHLLAIKAKTDLKKTIKACLVCNKLTSNITCSIKCANYNKRKILIEKSEQGLLQIGCKVYKNFLIEKFGDKCMECGWNQRHPITKKVPIQIEHIDGNFENNKFANLKLLCPNCHSLTPTFGALNKGKGRHFRRIRYAEGKSY